MSAQPNETIISQPEQPPIIPYELPAVVEEAGFFNSKWQWGVGLVFLLAVALLFFVMNKKVADKVIVETTPVPLIQTNNRVTNEPVESQAISSGQETPVTVLLTDQPQQKSDSGIHIYPYPNVIALESVEDVHIIGVIFRPKNGRSTIPTGWLGNMDDVLSITKSFFEKEFSGDMSITYSVVPQVIDGDKNIEDYQVAALVAEAQEKTKSYRVPGVYNVTMVYIVRDEAMSKNVIGDTAGGLPQQQAATQYEFWLDDEALEGSMYGLTGSMHEFGHALGLPHPWELPSNISRDPNYGNVPGDLMGYSNGRLPVSKLYLRQDMKESMGWKSL